MCSQSFGSSRNQHFISNFFPWSLQFGVAISASFLKTKKEKFSKFLSLPLPGVPEILKNLPKERGNCQKSYKVIVYHNGVHAKTSCD